jgi:hypothetical protein
MVTVLSLIGCAILLVLLVVSFRRQGEARGKRKQAEAHRHSPAAQAKQEQSRQRRAGVRAAHQERVADAAADE